MEAENSILLGFRRKLAARRARKRQRTFVYCPTCKFELCAGGEWVGPSETDPAIENYSCSRCGTFSAWNFDTPAPILLGWQKAIFGPLNVQVKL
jgi:hypothetical protein